MPQGTAGGIILRRIDTPNAVLAAVVLSTCVAAASGVVVISKVFGPTATPTELAVTETHTRPFPRPTSRVRPLLLPADTASVALGFEDPTLALSTPPALSAVAQTSAPDQRSVIAQAPQPTTETSAPDGPVQLARGIDASVAQGWIAPVQRPVRATAPITTAAFRVSDTRPVARPAILSTSEPAAQVVLASGGDNTASTRGLGLARLFAPRDSGGVCSDRLTRDMPRRPGSAPDGSAVMASLINAGGGDRDNAIVAQALSGNIPSHLRDLQPVTFSGLVGGQETQITICVTPDYLAIGSDDDHVRVPTGLPAALQIADSFEMMLPTTRMVDAIFAQADVRLTPRPMTPGAQMVTTAYFVDHDATLDAQMADAGGQDGLLIAGHKKDIVIANRMTNAPGRVAIYGWHRANGNPIQPLSTVHGAYYADYSHGIRLVSRTAYRNGEAVDLRALLTDQQYAGLLNSDGPMSNRMMQLAAR